MSCSSKDKSWLVTNAILWLLFLCGFAFAEEEPLDSTKDIKRQQCAGMYKKNNWGGREDPYIGVTILGNQDAADDAKVSVIVFEWADWTDIGVLQDDNNAKYLCDESAVANGLCSSANLGTYIIGPANGETSYKSIYTDAISLNDPHTINYPIKKTGYYCVYTYPYSGVDYEGVVLFRSSYGQLAATEIAKLPFYGGLAIAYAVFIAFWMFLYIQHKSDILPVQNYITACAVFLAVEMVVIWGYYDFVNRHGFTVFARFYMVVLAVLDSFRTSFTFFLLLIVCLGYGVVKPTLGKTMWRCWALAGAHFVFGVAASIISYTYNADDIGPMVLFIIVPLAITMTTFYVWILTALNRTIADLNRRRQMVKASMYKYLWRILLGSVIIIFAFFVIDSIAMADVYDVDYIPNHWQYRWFLLDGWLNIIYFIDFALISYIWRPTANNRRFAMSQELAQDDDEGFDIGSLAGSFDEERNEREDSNNREENPFADPSGQSGSGFTRINSNDSLNGTADTKGKDTKKGKSPFDDRYAYDADAMETETVFSIGDDDEDEPQKRDDSGSSKKGKEADNGISNGDKLKTSNNDQPPPSADDDDFTRWSDDDADTLKGGNDQSKPFNKGAKDE